MFASLLSGHSECNARNFYFNDDNVCYLEPFGNQENEVCLDFETVFGHPNAPQILGSDEFFLWNWNTCSNVLFNLVKCDVIYALESILGLIFSTIAVNFLSKLRIPHRRSLVSILYRLGIFALMANTLIHCLIGIGFYLAKLSDKKNTSKSNDKTTVELGNKPGSSDQFDVKLPMEIATNSKPRNLIDLSIENENSIELDIE